MAETRTSNFKNRTQLWKIRQELNYSSTGDNENTADATVTSYFNQLTLNEENNNGTQAKPTLKENDYYDTTVEYPNAKNCYDSLTFGEAHFQLLDKIRVCTNCKGTELDFVFDKNDQTILGKKCLKKTCLNFIAVADDTKSIHDIEAALRKLEANLCSKCNNKDLFNFTVMDSNNGFVIQCGKCKALIPLNRNKLLEDQYKDGLRNVDKLWNKNENPNQQEDTQKPAVGWYEWIAAPIRQYFSKTNKRQRDVRMVKPHISMVSTMATQYLPKEFLALDANLLINLIAIGGIEIYETVQDIKEKNQEVINGTSNGDECMDYYRRFAQGIGSVGFAMGMAYMGQYAGIAAVSKYGAQFLILPASSLGGMVGHSLGHILKKLLINKE